MQMKKIARRQNEDAAGGEKIKKNGKSNAKPRKTDDAAGTPSFNRCCPVLSTRCK